jgi:hypothetical protein
MNSSSAHTKKIHLQKQSQYLIQITSSAHKEVHVSKTGHIKLIATGTHVSDTSEEDDTADTARNYEQYQRNKQFGQFPGRQ